MNQRTLIIFILIVFTHCVNQRSNSHKNDKFRHLNQTLQKNIDSITQIIINNTNEFKKNIRQSGNTNKDLKKLASFYRLEKNLVSLNNLIGSVIDHLNYNTKQYENGIDKDSSLISKIISLKKPLDNYADFLKKNFAQYNSNSVPIYKRYLDGVQVNKEASFVAFYFKEADKEASLLVLNTWRLGILQEALVIQQKILVEE